MIRSTGGMMAAFTAGLLVAGTCMVQAQQGPAEKAGGALDRAGQKVGEKVGQAAGSVKRGAERVAEGVRGGFEKARESVHGMGVEARVYGRLHWDKALTDSTINLEMRDSSVVVLRGSVPDAAAKAKAATLASETVGVTSVVNELGVAPRTTTTTTTTKP